VGDHRDHRRPDSGLCGIAREDAARINKHFLDIRYHVTDTSEEYVTDIEIACLLDEAARVEIRAPVDDDRSEPAPVLVCSPQDRIKDILFACDI
jgi:hypothetical protein